jgi:hypothetical protein
MSKITEGCVGGVIELVIGRELSIDVDYRFMRFRNMHMPKFCSELGNLQKLLVIALMPWDYLQGSMTKEAD